MVNKIIIIISAFIQKRGIEKVESRTRSMQTQTQILGAKTKTAMALRPAVGTELRSPPPQPTI